jgi:hypothetical protein
VDPHFISDDELLRWLEEDEARTRPSRVERLRLLVEEYGSEGELRWFPGQVTYWAFNEARLAYLQGLFLACILLCQVCVEHVLGGLFMMAGDDKAARANFGQMLRAAGREGYLSAEEVDLFNRLRRTRNPYAHPRPFTPPDQEREEVDLSNSTRWKGPANCVHDPTIFLSRMPGMRSSLCYGSFAGHPSDPRAWEGAPRRELWCPAPRRGRGSPYTREIEPGVTSVSFRIGDVFDPDDDLGLWICTIALAFNDIVIAHARAVDTPEQWEFFYFTRVGIGHYNEILLYMERQHERPAIEAFIASLPPELQEAYKEL